MDFTVELLQNTTVASTTDHASFSIVSGFCHVRILLTVNASGTSGQEVKLNPTGMPALRYTATREPHGVFFYNDIGTNGYIGTVQWDGTSIRFQVSGSTSRLGGTPAFAVGSTDTLSVSFVYPVA